MFENGLRRPKDWLLELNLDRSLEWLNRLHADQARGSHPQLDRDIEDLEDHIGRLRREKALSAWEAAKERDDELSMYVAGQKMAAALRSVK